MYKGVYKIRSECIDPVNQEIHVPFIGCYFIHSIFLTINGLGEELSLAYSINYPIINWHAGYNVAKTDNVKLEVNYFYIKPDTDILGFLVDGTYTGNAIKSKEIMSKHYTDGQFSLDNGLYKNAVLNFGTVLEALLNKTLVNANLGDLIDNYTGQANKADMHILRTLRNKVHPNRIANTQDVTREEAINARSILEQILKEI